MSTPIELDHLFLFIEPDGPELSRLVDAGLTVTYRRAHVGQGTANACFCFDNLFLELLWVTAAHEITSPAVVRTRLHERSRWRAQPACPFGIAWRESDVRRLSGVARWMFQPPYLPAGKHIEVATDSDDPTQPMLFTFPGATPPASWPTDRRGALQHTAGLARISGVTLLMPESVSVSPALLALATHSMLHVARSSNHEYALVLDIEHTNGSARSVLSLPSCQLVSR
jgi:hypothetical protein